MIFRNPLVEPGFLGVSQGAAFGAAFSILFLSRSVLVIEVSATVFALLGLILSYSLSRRIRYGGWILRLVLAGIAAIGLDTASIDRGKSELFKAHQILFSAGIPVFENVANLDQLPVQGFEIVALPMKIEGGSGAPLRIIAILK